MQKKLIYLLIALIVLEVIFGIIYLSKKTKVEPPPTPIIKKEIFGGELSLSPASGNFKVNELIEVKILVDTKGKVLTGADCIINYNPEEIEVLGDPIPGNIFPFYLYAKNKKDKQIVDISATITDPSQTAFTGIGELATMTVKPLKAGQTALNFEFTPGKTNDSNLSEKDTSLDVLTEVTNATFNITQ